MNSWLNLFLIVLIFGACSGKDNAEQTNAELQPDTIVLEVESPKEEPIDIEPYFYDTILTGGFHLSYRVYTDSVFQDLLQSLTLMKGRNEIAILSEISYPLPQKNLGYIGADFEDTFVFVHSFGSGNPNYFELIEKETGQVLRIGTLVDVNVEQQILLYEDGEENDKHFVGLIIYDSKNNHEIRVDDFNGSDCAIQSNSGLRDCVEIDTVTAKQIVLKIDNEEEKIVKIYPRN
ncbi:MAG: hypothetical protein KDC34_10595 [Saprospiraceae bacterium]|nr:hypothetical protein [Saprospiraceae bacterium]